MRPRPTIASASIFVAAILVALAPAAFAQGQLPQPPIGLQPPPPPPPAPVKPYTPVAVTPAQSFNDASFDAFRKNLADVVQHKDRAALAKLVVAQGFFWVQEKNVADPSKPGIDNLAKAIDLDNADGSGWDVLASDADDPTLAELPQIKDIFCAPAPPKFDPQAFEALVQGTDTDPTDWGYPGDSNVEIRAAGQANAPVVGKLDMAFVRVLSDNTSTAQYLHVALPDGKTGYVTANDIEPLASDQICYRKAADAWKIAGYIGGVSP